MAALNDRTKVRVTRRTAQDRSLMKYCSWVSINQNKTYRIKLNKHGKLTGYMRKKMLRIISLSWKWNQEYSNGRCFGDHHYHQFVVQYWAFAFPALSASRNKDEIARNITCAMYTCIYILNIKCKITSNLTIVSDIHSKKIHQLVKGGSGWNPHTRLIFELFVRQTVKQGWIMQTKEMAQSTRD